MSRRLGPVLRCDPGAVFPANTFLDANWTFDTYRLTYRDYVAI